MIFSPFVKYYVETQDVYAREIMIHVYRFTIQHILNMGDRGIDMALMHPPELSLVLTREMLSYIPLLSGRVLRMFTPDLYGAKGLIIIVLVLIGVVVGALLLTRGKTVFKKVTSGGDAIDELVPEAKGRIKQVVMEVSRIYTDSLGGLGIRDPEDLQKNMINLSALEAEMVQLSEEIWTVLQSSEKNLVKSGKPYVSILDHLQGMIRSVGNVTANSYDHLKNHHRNLSFNQIRELRSIYERSACVFELLNAYYDNRKSEKLQKELEDSFTLFQYVSDLAKIQKERLKDDCKVASNRKLYVNLLVDTRDLIGNTVNLLCLLYDFPPPQR